jgi:hypothetical protein
VEELLEALKGVNVVLNSSDLVSIAKYWFLKSMIDNIFAFFGWNLFILIVMIGIYKCVQARS